MTKKKKAYARAGVDVDLGNRLKRSIQQLVRQTHGPEVLGKIGGFGGLFRAELFRHARAGAGRERRWRRDETEDRFRHEPPRHRRRRSGESLRQRHRCPRRASAFLSRLHRMRKNWSRASSINSCAVFRRACRAAGCALIGGETAQMPGMYRKGEYDLAGCIVGVVDRAKIIDGSRKSDLATSFSDLPSNGLHTNGYSLARKILFEKMRFKPSSRMAGLTNSIGDELLRVHTEIISRCSRKFPPA